MLITNNSPIQYSLYGSLLGGAVGDAYGLTYEGIHPKRLAKRFRQDNRYHLIPFIDGGMVSDDTEHAVMTVQAYISSIGASGGDVETFKKSLKWRLVLWLLALPAGIGMATGRAIFKIMLGFSTTGVYSAGNGVAMRASVLGVVCADLDKLKAMIHASSVITHTDPKAEQGALAVALLAWIECYQPDWTVAQSREFLVKQLAEHSSDNELLTLIDTYQPNEKGVLGYIYDTVPAVIQTWQQYRDDPVQGLNHLIALGGDTDTAGAIFGGIVGVRHGEAMFKQISGTWCEPILTPQYFAKLANQIEQISPRHNFAQVWQYPITLLLKLLRNLLFLVIVLLHGFRRIFPPY